MIKSDEEEEKKKMSAKFLTAQEAVELIPDGATVASSGFRFAASPEELLKALGNRYRDTGAPRGLTIVFSSAQGDSESRGLDHLAQQGLLKRVVGGFFGVTPRLRALITNNMVEAYNLPQGQITQLYHAIASGQPGLVSSVGLGTFVDPRLEGGKCNTATQDDLTEVVELAGKEWLLYRSFPIDVALIRGTTADTRGNISMEREAVRVEALVMAQATRNSGGKVLVQVERVAAAGSLHPRSVEIPSCLVDVVVLSQDPFHNHTQTLLQYYNPAFNGDVRVPPSAIPKMDFGVRKIIARRAARELSGGEVVNLGSGMPEGVGSVLAEEGGLDSVYLTLESGVIGGVPESQPDFGVATNPDAIIRHDDQFCFYNGGGIDVTFLGFAQVDAQGNVNVSRFGSQLMGCGGFIDIAQNAKKVVFCGTLNSGGLEVECSDGKLNICRNGRHRKFLSQVEQVTFGGPYAVRTGQPVIFVTERCVFELSAEGLVLTEIAPGVDLEADILQQMDFEPIVPSQIPEMDSYFFAEK